MQLGSSIEMMPSTGMPEQSPTTRLVVAKSPVVEVTPTQVSPSSSSEKVNYSVEDVNWRNVLPAPDHSKFSLLTIEDMEVTSVKGKFSPVVPFFVVCICTFLCSLYRHVSDILSFWYFFQ